tara:strand:- start:4012 stop:5076 length:1065 start_codon:yes stop_codon:yes gene_type:complete
MKPAQITVNLKAIQQNWRTLANKNNGNCAAVVKADAYGLGAIPITESLYAEGCRSFFVAYLQEAISIKPVAPAAQIFILNGVAANNIEQCNAENFTIVINSLEQMEEIQNIQEKTNIALHFDTGINRLGLQRCDVKPVQNILRKNININVTLVMSHLACADEPQNQQNRQQLEKFIEISKQFPNIPYSFANSSGIFLGKPFHFDMLRPGYALYGGNPTPYNKNPMQQTFTLTGNVIQIKSIDKGGRVGYGASWTAKKPTKLAIISCGYADGFTRAHSNISTLQIGKYKAPIIGRVSMDMMTVDITDIPQNLKKGDAIILLGGDNDIDKMASKISTIGYELISQFSSRIQKTYIK